MNDSLKKLRKELGKPESVTKVWTAQGILGGQNRKWFMELLCESKKQGLC